MVGNIYITGGGQWQNTSVAASGTPEIYTDYNVGIGTNNPLNGLDVNQSEGRVRVNKFSHLLMQNKNDSTTDYWGISARNGGELDIGYGTPDGNSLIGGDKLTITSAGNIGIGINNPAYELEVASSDTTTFNITAGGNTNLSRLFFSDDDAVARGYLNYDHQSDNLLVATAGAERLRVFSDGSVRIGDNSIAVAAVGSGPTLAINGSAPEITLRDSATNNPYAVMRTNDFGSLTLEADQGNNAANSTIHFRVDNTERLRIETDGQVVINRPSGAVLADSVSKLEVYNATENIIFVANSTAATGQDAGIMFAPANNVYGGKIIVTSDEDFSTGVNRTAHMAFYTRHNGTAAEKLRITSAGRMGVGTNDPNALLEVRDSENTTQGNAQIRISKGVGSGAAPASTSRANTYLHLGGTEWGSGANGQYLIGFGYTNDEVGTGIPAYIGFKETSTASYTQGDLIFGIRNNTTGTNNPTERVRFRADGTVHVGPSNYSFGTPGVRLSQISDSHFCRSGGNVIAIRRNTNDGSLLDFYQDGNAEGAINVSGSDVTLAGATLSRWTQLPGNAERTEILRGTVLSNLDEMCEWGDEDNEQLNRMKVSDVEGDVNVAGVFRCWDDDDETYLNDYYCAMTGDFVIRIAQGVTVARGDLLMSAGDGTAKPQGDDIVRSKTVAKVTSTTVSATYSDGSYCVPCVLMAC
jgi:hypothetical protein